MFRIEAGAETFRIMGPNDEEGERVEFGEVATLRIGKAIYYALLDDPASLPDKEAMGEVCRVTQAESIDTPVEWAEFSDEPYEDDPDGGDGADDDDDDEGDGEEEERPYLVS